MSDKTKSLLSKLPEVKDHRSKETIYQGIQNKMSERGNDMKNRKKRAPWIIPSFATAVVLMLAVFLTPGLLDQSNNNSEIALTESAPDNDASSANDSATTATLGDGKKIVDDPIGKAEDTNKGFSAQDVVKFDHYVPAMQQGKENVVISYPDDESLALVPLSFELNNNQSVSERITEIFSSFDESSQGLGDTLLTKASYNVETIEGKKTLIADFATAGDSLSSNESIGIRDSIQWLADSIGAQQVSWKTNGEDGYTLGNFGAAEESMEQAPSAFYLFETNTDTRYLVKGSPLYGEDASDLESVLSKMKTTDSENNAYLPSIPEGVTIASIEKRDNLATITFTEDSKFVSEEEAMETLEAIMLTASQFGYSKVSFLNTGFERVGPYTLYEALQIPESPNATNLTK